MPQANSRSNIPKLPRALPSDLRKVVNKAINQHLAATEALISFLDAADGDPEEEPCVTEGPHDEDTDREPSLAHTNDNDQARAFRFLKDQTVLGHAHPMDMDLEAEHDGREPDEDFEWSQADDQS